MFKFLKYDLRRNLIKIFCLSVGLAIGLLLIAKVYFSQTFDSSLPDIERIYIVTESTVQQGEYKEYKQTPGAVAPGLERYVPQVEKATRTKYLFGQTKAVVPDGRKFDVPVVYMTDSCFFDVIKTDIIVGNPKEALALEWKCMIPRSLADKIGGDVMGMKIVSPDMGEQTPVEIAGVYEDFPINSSFSNGIYLSLATIPHFEYDGRDNWMGNDSYHSYVRIAEGTNPDELKPYIRKMLEDNIDSIPLKESHYDIGIIPLLGNYSSQKSVKTMNWMLSLLALIILGSASLNYLLIVIAQMQWRGKEMAVRKCYGTNNKQIFSMIVGESFLFMLVSLVFASLIVVSLSSECEQLLGVSVANLLKTGRLWILEIFVCLAILAVTGVVPAWLYCHTPVANAFRRNTPGKKRWKLVLLAIQFFASTFLFCLLMLVARQYRFITDADMGYEYKKVAMANMHRLSDDERKNVVEELKRLGCVENVATAFHDFTSYASGNNIYNENNAFDQVNVGDMYYANPEIFDVLGMKFIQGSPFEAFADSSLHQAVVEKRFIEDLHKVQDFEGDWIAGRKFLITQHSHNNSNKFEIRGVIADTRKNGFYADRSDLRSGVLFPITSMQSNLYVRFNNLNNESLEEARNVIDSLYSEKDIVLIPMKSKIDGLNAPVRQFGTSVMIAGIVIIIIALIGLIGYTVDQVQRRAKEIAIRKVNGMSISGILRIFCIDVLRVAVPAALLGFVMAMIIGKDWLSLFTDQVGLSPLSMLAVVVLILGLLLIVVVVSCMNVVKTNPVKYLRNE